MRGGEGREKIPSTVPAFSSLLDAGCAELASKRARDRAQEGETWEKREKKKEEISWLSGLRVLRSSQLSAFGEQSFVGDRRWLHVADAEGGERGRRRGGGEKERNMSPRASSTCSQRVTDRRCSSEFDRCAREGTAKRQEEEKKGRKRKKRRRGIHSIKELFPLYVSALGCCAEFCRQPESR